MSMIWQQLGAIATATVAAGQDDRGTVDPAIRALWQPMRMCGIAYTIAAPAADNKPVHLAIAEAPADSVLVACNGGHRETAIIGDILIRNMMQRGFRGFVTDGVIRDLSECRDLGLPIFASGVCMRGPGKDDIGTRGQPVNLGGVLVETGDYILGDDDGLVVVKPHEAEAVLERARAKETFEQEVMRRIEAGENSVEIFGIRE